MIVPSRFRATKRHRVLWATLNFLDEHPEAAPFEHFDRGDVRKAVGRRQTIWESRVADRVADYFEEERQQVVHAVRNTSEPGPVLDQLEPDLADVLGGAFSDVARAHRAWVVEHVVSKARAKPKPADPFTASLQSYLRKYTALRVAEISKTTRERIRAALAEGEAAAESVEEVAARIDELYLEQIIPNRSMVIARTETGSAANWAGLEGARETGVRMTKEWATNVDGRERDSHREADGQRVELDEDFTVGGEALGFPGDPRGSAENVIQCRCFLLYKAEG